MALHDAQTVPHLAKAQHGPCIEAEEGWRIVAPILEGWATGAVPLLEYRAGGAGSAGWR